MPDHGERTREQGAGREEAPRDAKHVPRLKTLKEAIEEAGEADWIIPGLFARGDVCVLDDGAAWGFVPRMDAFALCLRLALAVARGAPFFGLATKRHPVIYADLENGRARVARHLRAAGVRPDAADPVSVVSDPQAFDALCAHVRVEGPPVLIAALDPTDGLRALHRLRELVDLSREANTGLWLMHPWDRSEGTGRVLSLLSDVWARVRAEPYGHVLEMSRGFAPDMRILVSECRESKTARPAVYFIRAGSDGPIKIGASASPRGRLASPQTANPEKLSIIAILPEAEEREVQAKFADEHLQGEWFAPSERLLAWVRAHAVLWPCDDEP